MYQQKCIFMGFWWIRRRSALKFSLLFFFFSPWSAAHMKSMSLKSFQTGSITRPVVVTSLQWNAESYKVLGNERKKIPVSSFLLKFQMIPTAIRRNRTRTDIMDARTGTMKFLFCFPLHETDRQRFGFSRRLAWTEHGKHKHSWIAIRLMIFSSYFQN